MSAEESLPVQEADSIAQKPTFEGLLRCTPVLESLLLQLPTQSILALYQTSSKLRNFLGSYPTSWKYLSFRLNQPSLIATAAAASNANNPPQSSNYTLDQLILYMIIPISTCLTSLELDNTAVCGTVLISTVLHLRRDTLEHLSVRGCKNVSLKYHINPWLKLFGRVNEAAPGSTPPARLPKLALKSLYTYRCRHHRRRPYLPSSLTRKDSDSEPTDNLVNICHELGIWTDTAWCTTPGGRCYRRRGYVTMRVPQDPREVWVVFDRLWRSRNWIGSTEPGVKVLPEQPVRKRKRDGRSWESEEGIRGEALGIGKEGKVLPAHLRRTHREFVEDVHCHNCSAPILERCEQCSVTMHCAGCRKTLCSSCAFDRPYLRNKTATEEGGNKFWWAPGCVVSPCSMLDQDPTPTVPGTNPTQLANTAGLPSSKFKWCCTEPVFSGGGGITFGPGSHPDHDQIRAAPLPKGHGWEDVEFLETAKTVSTNLQGPAGRWSSIDSLFRRDDLYGAGQTPSSVPRILCDDCYSSDQWKVRCKACSIPLCLKHDLRDKLRVRMCGYKDLSTEKQEFRLRQKAEKSTSEINDQKGKAPNANSTPELRTPEYQHGTHQVVTASGSRNPIPIHTQPATPAVNTPVAIIASSSSATTPSTTMISPALQSSALTPGSLSEEDLLIRPSSPGSNSTAAPSRASSPTPSLASNTSTPNSSTTERRFGAEKDLSPNWSGCQMFLCPQNRAPGDHRRRCAAVVRQCLECKVNVCGECAAAMEPSCPCTGCRLPTSEGVAPSPTSDNAPFFCPNCRWERRQTGKCKRRVATLWNTSKRRKHRHRKPLSERRPAMNATGSPFNGLDNEMAEMAGEFLEALYITVPPTQVDRIDGINTLREQTTEEIQELADMGELARDLIHRIQRLRAQFRPGSLAAAALPVIRLDETVDIVNATVAAPTPVVDEMD